MLVTYVHGVTAEMAEDIVGEEGIPILLGLLTDPNFPRRDNVVAFLGHLGGDETADGLVAFLRNPPRPAPIPEEDRALLLAPRMLGQVAARGSARALEVLLEITADGSGGGIASAASRVSSRPAWMCGDLIEQALFGLAIAGDRAARERLEDVAAGHVKPAKTGRDQRGAAGQALGQRSELSPLLDGPAGGGAATSAFDTNTTFHDSLIDYANHPAVSDPMTDSRLDSVLDDGSSRVFQDDGALSGGADTACCVSFSRKGVQQTFGSSADGLDAIDTYSELITVLNDQTARAKVVRQINYCSGPGTNIIGCAWVSGNGLAVVRMSSLGQEAALWVHEYGHNIGNGHNNLGTNWIMYGSLGSNNRGILQSECDQYH